MPSPKRILIIAGPNGAGKTPAPDCVTSTASIGISSMSGSCTMSPGALQSYWNGKRNMTDKGRRHQFPHPEIDDQEFIRADTAMRRAAYVAQKRAIATTRLVRGVGRRQDGNLHRGQR